MVHETLQTGFYENNETTDQLPEKVQKVFIKWRFVGLRSEKISKMYDIFKRTGDNHIAKGIRYMRLHLKEFTVLCITFLS